MKAFAIITFLAASTMAKNEPCGDSVDCVILCQEGRFAPIGPQFFGGPPRFGCTIGLGGGLAAALGGAPSGDLMAKACGSASSADKTAAACRSARGKMCSVSSYTACILNQQNIQRFDNSCGSDKAIVMANKFSEDEANKFCEAA